MDITLMDLWLPVLVAAIACFFMSSVMWMVSPHHRADIKALPDEAAYTEAVGRLNLKPGFYMYPNCSKGEAHGSESMKARWEAGPWGTVNVLGGKPNFARNLLVNFTEGLAIAAIVGYLASMSMGTTAGGQDIVRFTFTGAFLGFVLGGFSGAAFLGTPTRFIMTTAFDALVYSAIVAASFYFLWPSGGAGALPGVTG